MKIYADTNFLSRLYLERPETAEAEHALAHGRQHGLSHLPITWLLRIELINSFEQYVFVSRTTGRSRVTPEQAAAAQAGFTDDLREGSFLQMREVALVEVLAQAEEMARRHTARHGFRTYDLLHVASALNLACEVFWSFDDRARKLARLEGLETN